MKYYYNKTKKEIDNDMLDIILEVGRIFHYRTALIYYNFRNFTEFENYKYIIFLHTYMYNHSLYDFAKNKNKFLNKPFIKNFIPWHELDNLLNVKLTEKEIEYFKFDKNIKTRRDGLINIVEENFSAYMQYDSNLLFERDDPTISHAHVIYEIYEKLNSENRLDHFKDLVYNEDENDNTYKLIYRQPITRRYQ